MEAAPSSKFSTFTTGSFCTMISYYARAFGSSVMALTLVMMSVPSCDAAGKSRTLPRPERSLAFGRGMWNSTPKAAELPLQKKRAASFGNPRKHSLSTAHCQLDNKPRNIPSLLKQAKSNLAGICKEIPTIKGAIALASLAAIW